MCLYGGLLDPTLPRARTPARPRALSRSCILYRGFNDWNELAAHYPKWKNGLNESDVLGIANVMVSSGLKDKGYRYVNLDCGYSTGGSNSHKPLAVDSEKFPSGLKALGQ